MPIKARRIGSDLRDVGKTESSDMDFVGRSEIKRDFANPERIQQSGIFNKFTYCSSFKRNIPLTSEILT